MSQNFTGLSLFTGAGGMDIGFEKAGIKILGANEINKDAAETYRLNHPTVNLIEGDINKHITELKKFSNVDIIFGGPPCQGFSVAGKMDVNDERNKLIWSFLETVEIIKPKAFVMENVKALGKLEKWKSVRKEIIDKSIKMGYSCYPIILNSVDYGVPQKRERVFFIGIKDNNSNLEILNERFNSKKKKKKTVGEVIKHLGPAGTISNPNTCTAKITFATNPVLRKSPYAGMLFNGMGRPINLEDAANTLPASMGGNKTPIIDDKSLYENPATNFIEEFHRQISKNGNLDLYKEVPPYLRRLTINEALILQSFPENYRFYGSKSSIYKQIGNAVPCELAKVVAEVVLDELTGREIESGESMQLSIF